MPNRKKRKLTWHSRIILISAAVVIFLPLLALHFLLTPILGHELISLIEGRLNAHFTVRRIVYRPLYGLSLYDCHLVFVDPHGKNQELLSLSELTVKLAQLPIHKGPLQVQDLTIRGPIVHLIRTPDGFEGQNGLLKPDNSPQAPNHQKLSDILRLRHVTLEDGQVLYEDLTQPAGHPFAFSGIAVHITTAPKNAAEYHFNFSADTGSLSSLSAAGDFNVDDLSAAVDPFALTVQLPGGQPPSQVPPEIQAILQQYQVKGTLILQGTASGSATVPGQGKSAVTFKLHDASAYCPQVDGALSDLQLEIAATANASGASAKINTFSARTGGSQLSLQPGAILSIDPNQLTWKLQQLAGSFTADRREEIPFARGLLRQLSPDGSINFTADLNGPILPTTPWPDSIGQAQITTNNLSLQPAGCVAPIVITTGPIRLVGNVLSIRDIQADYGGDQFALSSARIPIPPLTQQIIQCNDLTASLSLHPGGFAYPWPLTDFFAQYQPAGHFAISGTGSADLSGDQPNLNYDILLSGDNGALSAGPIPISQITFDAEIKPAGAQLADFQCDTLDGKITTTSFTAKTQSPFPFSGNIFMYHLNLGELDKILKLTSGNTLNGFVDINSKLSGSGPVNGKSFLDLLYAEGQFELSKGNLWSIAALKKIEDSASIAKEALTLGRAAAMFRIYNRVIELQDAAVSSPTFGVMGWGTIGFDGQLDIHAVAALLGDWRAQLSKVNNFLGDIAGTIQDFLNTATSQLLYQIRLTGPGSDPKVESTRGNALTKHDARTLGNMVQQSNDARPLDMLNQTPPPAPALPAPGKKP